MTGATVSPVSKNFANVLRKRVGIKKQKARIKKKLSAFSAYLCDLCVEIVLNAIAEVRREPQR